MLQQFIDFVLRRAEPKPFYPANASCDPLRDHARSEGSQPSSAFLAQILRSALIQKRAQEPGYGVIHRSSDERPQEPLPQDAEQPDAKIIRFVPRQKPQEPPQPKDDDPGPSAA